MVFWDVFGKQGHPIRATVSEMGPLLLSRLLGLNDTQAGVLTLVFKIADDSGLLLLDLKDLQAMLQYVGRTRRSFRPSTAIFRPRVLGRFSVGWFRWSNRVATCSLVSRR